MYIQKFYEWIVLDSKRAPSTANIFIKKDKKIVNHLKSKFKLKVIIINICINSTQCHWTNISSIDYVIN